MATEFDDSFWIDQLPTGKLHRINKIKYPMFRIFNEKMVRRDFSVPFLQSLIQTSIFILTPSPVISDADINERGRKNQSF
jgi:hypothetical protein